MSLPEAREWGAVALFGETYDESVRVIQVGGPWSRELCGGTHVSRSSQVGLVSIIGESSVGSGSRRLEALVGIEAFRSLATERALVARLGEALKSPKAEIEERFMSTIEELKQAQRKLAQMQAAQLATRIPEFTSAAITIGSTKLVEANLGEVGSVDDLRGLATQIRELLGAEAGVIALYGVVAEKPMVLIATTEAARASGHKAGNLVRTASQILGGGGGGKDDLAQGGGTDVAKISEAQAAVRVALGA
jgi:alanyl-tRNA synthetase